jgi:hypothetical protein
VAAASGVRSVAVTEIIIIYSFMGKWRQLKKQPTRTELGRKWVDRNE